MGQAKHRLENKVHRRFAVGGALEMWLTRDNLQIFEQPRLSGACV